MNTCRKVAHVQTNKDIRTNAFLYTNVKHAEK